MSHHGREERKDQSQLRSASSSDPANSQNLGGVYSGRAGPSPLKIEIYMYERLNLVTGHFCAFYTLHTRICAAYRHAHSWPKPSSSRSPPPPPPLPPLPPPPLPPSSDSR